MVEPAARFEEVKIPLREPVHDLDSLSGVLGVPEWWPTGSRVGVVLAHGSSSDMRDPMVEWLHRELTERKFLSLRFNFPFAEAGRSRPDPLPVLDRAYRAAITLLGRDPTSAPAHLVLGGLNLGGSVAAELGAGGMHVDGFFFLGYPLHPQGKPEKARPDHLFRIISPMLFVQGTRDRSCDLGALRSTLARVGAPTALHTVEEADQRFRVTKKSPRSVEEVQREVLEAVVGWIDKLLES